MTTINMPEHLVEDLAEVRGLIERARREVAQARGEPEDLLGAITQTALDMDLLVNCWLTVEDVDEPGDVVCIRHAARTRAMRQLAGALRQVLALEGQ